MNKNDIKQIILEEIEAAINEMASPEELAADSRPEEDDRIARAMETGDEDELEDLAAGELDRAEIERDWRDEQDAMFGKPNFVEEEGLEEMARTSNVFKLSQEASMKDVLQFMQRVNDVLKTYKSPGQKRPKKRFTPEEMKALATAMLNPEGFTSKDVIAATSYNSPAQANKFLKALEMKGLITLTSQLKKSMKPERDPNAPETRGRKRKDSEFDVADDPDMMDFGDFDNLDLSDPLAENNNTMSELEKYIKQQIREAKNPLAKKMKEIETQGRIAALETKLAAVAEMIEETEGRLTRIDEDNEFRDMMDKNAVKEVRKQLKELERTQAKLQKEYDKAAGGRKKEKVVDELDAEETRAKADKFDDLADRQDALDQEAGEVEEVSFELNESILRMQKLAGLITESDIKKKLSLNENLGAKLAKNMEVELTMMNKGEDDYEIMVKYIPKFKSATSDEEAKAILDQFSKEMGQASGTFAGDITAAHMDNISLNEEATPEQIKATESLTNALLNASHARSAIHMAANNTPYVKYDKSRAIGEFDLGVIGFKIDEKYFTNPKMAFVLYRQNLDKLKDLPKRNIKSGRGADSRIEASKQVYNEELANIEAAAKKLEATLK